MCSKIAEPEFSSHLPRSPIAQSGAVSGKPLTISKRGTLEPSLFIQFPRHLSFLQHPQASERDPFYRSFQKTCFSRDSLACVPVSHPEGVCSNLRVYPGLEQLLERESLTAPRRQSPALFPFESGPTATARNASQYQAAGGCILWFLC